MYEKGVSGVHLGKSICDNCRIRAYKASFTSKALSDSDETMTSDTEYFDEQLILLKLNELLVSLNEKSLQKSHLVSSSVRSKTLKTLGTKIFKSQDALCDCEELLNGLKKNTMNRLLHLLKKRTF